MPRAVSILLLLALAACGGKARLPPPPLLFPLVAGWVRDLDAPVRAPLATDGARLFVAGEDGALVALSVESGSPQWQTAPGAGRLAAAPGLLVLRRGDGTVSALDPATGAVRWTRDTGLTGDLPPVLHEQRVLVAGTGLAALDAESGRVLWKVDGPQLPVAPAAAGQWLLAWETEVGLRARSTATGEILWTMAKAAPGRDPMAVDVAGKSAFGPNGRTFQAVGLGNGNRRWRWKLGTEVAGSPVLLNDRVLFASLEAVLYAMKRGSGNLAWRAPLVSRPLSGPLLVENGVLVLCYGRRPEETLVLGFDGRTGAVLGEFTLPGEVQGPALRVGPRLVAALDGPRLAAFRLAGFPSLP